MKNLMFIILPFFLSLSAFAQTKTFVSKQKRFKEMLTKGLVTLNSPFIQENGIIFFYRGDAKTVVVAGDFNDWQPRLLMKKQANGVRTLIWDKRLKAGTYRYKLIVDDIWIADPLNTNFIIDNAGQRVSVFTLKHDFIPHKKFPLYIKGEFYRFQYKDFHARHVSLVGDFNNWNPYATPLEYKGAGIFTIDVKLKPGFHTYCFVADDEWVPDPNNLRQYADETGTIVNVFYVSKK